jgi:hypothetical protein
MPRNRLRVITGAALAANLAAAALTLMIARQPTGPGGPDQGLYECTLWFIVIEFLLLAAYYACILHCESQDEGRELCYRNCLLWWIYMDILVVLGYLTCLVNAVWF